MAVSLTPEIIKDNVLPTVVELVNDPIPNVRFNVAKSLEVLAPILKQNPQTAEAVSTKINDVLQQLSQDSDVDVKWFAEKAILTGKTYYNLIYLTNTFFFIIVQSC